MKRRKNTKSWVFVVLTGVVGLIMAMNPSQVSAQCPTTCPTKGNVFCTQAYLNCPISQTCDADSDGIPDYYECTGIYLYDKSPFTGYNNRGTSTRDKYLDPNSPDLFVILAGSTYFGQLTNPLEFISNPKANGGLEIATHIIQPGEATSDRYFGFANKNLSNRIPQKAVKVTESLDPGTGANTLILASSASMHGTPNDTDLSTVYTQRIVNLIVSNCGPYCGGNTLGNIQNCGGGKCCDSTGTICNQQLINTHIKHTMAHEIAHQLMLTNTLITGTGEYHYKAGTGVVLDQSVSVSTSSPPPGGKAIFSLGLVFTDTDKNDADLK